MLCEELRNLYFAKKIALHNMKHCQVLKMRTIYHINSFIVIIFRLYRTE